MTTPSRLQVFGWLADYGGCGHYRVVFPLRGMDFEGLADIELSTLGRFLKVEPHVGPYAFDDRWDVVVAQRTMGEGATAFFQHQLMEATLRVFELDDDLWNIHPSNEPAYSKIGAPEPQARLRANALAADLITTTCPFLADRIIEEVISLSPSHVPPVAVLGNHVPGAVLQYPVAYTEADGSPSAPVRVGWALSSSHVVDMPEVFDALRLLKRKWGQGMRFETVGQDRIPQWAQRNIDVTERGWYQLAEGGYFPALDFDIGLAPLAPLLFNRSKSDLKLVEYASRGIPWVASDVGPYSAWRDQHGVSGFLVRNTLEWKRRVSQLIKSPGLRRRMGEAGRRYVRDHRLYEDRAHDWAEAYRKAL